MWPLDFAPAGFKSLNLLKKLLSVMRLTMRWTLEKSSISRVSGRFFCRLERDLSSGCSSLSMFPSGAWWSFVELEIIGPALISTEQTSSELSSRVEGMILGRSSVVADRPALVHHVQGQDTAQCRRRAAARGAPHDAPGERSARVQSTAPGAQGGARGERWGPIPRVPRSREVQPSGDQLGRGGSGLFGVLPSMRWRTKSSTVLCWRYGLAASCSSRVAMVVSP